MPMMATEPAPFPFDLTITNSDQAFVWSRQWFACTGVPAADLTADVRNVVLGTGAAVSLKPAIQFATTRTDRPDDGALIVNGTAITANDLRHYGETLSTGAKFYFRHGMGYKLTAGAFARAQGVLYAAFTSYGSVLPGVEIVFQPTNDTNAVSYFPLFSKPVPTNRIDVAKAVVFGMGNLTTTMDWRLAGRAFNDPLARGAWTDLGAGWNTPQLVDFDANTTELGLSGLSLSTKQWMELALAVRKTTGGDTNSRVIFQVIPALEYIGT
jgi:hypothetical protein